MFFNGRSAATPRNSSYTSAHIKIITSVADPDPSDPDPDPAFHFDTDPRRFEEVMYLKQYFYTSLPDFPCQ